MLSISHRISYVLIIAIIFCAAHASGQEMPIVNSIGIKGLKRIDDGAVKVKLSQKIGNVLSQPKINEDIKTIFKMGYFDDVKVEIEAFEGGVKVIYSVKEKPTIIRIEFSGNKEIEETKLREIITITPGSIADTVLIQDNVSIIKSHYEEEGYWLSNIVPVINKLTENEVTLTYQIDEGSKLKIDHIIFEGNNALSSSKISKAIETKEWGIFSFITSSGHYKEIRMKQDLEKIKSLYFENGFIKVAVADPIISIDEKNNKMTVTVKISEGDQYKVASIDFANNTVFDNDAVRGKITIAPGIVFNKKILERDIAAISSLYSDSGYALASVVPDLIPDDSNKTVRIILNISEGDKYRIGKIEVSGNTKTIDKVIRREVRLDEGETFNSSKIKRSYERINNLNFFESVDMVPKPNYEEKVVDMEIRVKERPTGFLSLGGGYSSADGFIATVDLTQGNLFGKGQYLKLKGELGGKTNHYEISYKDPWFLDYPVSFSTGIYKNNREYDEYDKDAFGVYFGFGKNFTEYWKGNLTYNYEEATIENIDPDASVIIKDQEGTNTTSSITALVARDSRDSYIDPTRGSRNAVSFTFAGLGGSNAFVKSSIDSAWYIPLMKTAFMVRGRFGYADGIFGEELPLYERFYVGGINTVRGLGFGEAGPQDPLTGDEIGGTTELIFNFEFIFPILQEAKLKGVTFFDAGNSYEGFDDFGELRYTTGAGIRWISPMGPIRVEWGYNIDKKEGEDSNKIEFAFGSFF